MSRECSIQSGAASFGKFALTCATGAGISLATSVAVASLGAGLGVMAPPIAGLVVSQLALRYATPYLPKSWQTEAKAATNFLLVSGVAWIIAKLVVHGLISKTLTLPMHLYGSLSRVMGIVVMIFLYFYMGHIALEADRLFRRGFGAQSGQPAGS